MDKRVIKKKKTKTGNEPKKVLEQLKQRIRLRQDREGKAGKSHHDNQNVSQQYTV